MFHHRQDKKDASARTIRQFIEEGKSGEWEEGREGEEEGREEGRKGGRKEGRGRGRKGERKEGREDRSPVIHHKVM